MSTATAPERSHAPYAEPDEYIDYQLRKTQTGIKRTDMLTAGAVAVTVLIGYVLLFVLFDHWLFEGGVGGSVRVLMFLPVMGFLGWLIGAKVIWPALKNVTGLFAAKTLESSSSEFRSSLLSLIDLRRADRPVAPAILATMEKRVAVTLTKLDVEDAIDKRPLLVTLYVLFGIVVAFCLYSVLSPKKLGPSVLRAIAPFTNVTPATQTEILEVKPGDAKLRAGGSLPISVRLRGEIPSKVLLLFTTSDRRFVDEPFELGQMTDPFQFEGTFGEDGQGLLQSFSYRVVAGDARSPDYQVTIITPPSATVTEVRFDYPEYMELDPRTQSGGAIDVWEQTAVTITAATNVPVASAEFELSDTDDFKGAYPGVSPKLDGSDKKKLTIAWKADPRQIDRKFPKFYRVRVWDADRNPDPKPAIYPINVRLDLPPQVALLDPTTDLKLPANGTVPLVVAARDQDFKLRSVSLKIARDENDVTDEDLYDSDKHGPQQEVALKHDFHLEPLRLKTGDRIKIWIEAQDNRLPTHNLAKTEPLTIEIADRVSKDEAKKQLDEQKQEQQKKLDQARDNNNDGAERPEQQPSDPKSSPNADDSRDPMPRNQQEQRDPNQQDKDQSNQSNKPNQTDSKSNDKSPKGQSGSSGQPQKGNEKQPDSSKSDGQSGEKQSGKNGEASPNDKTEKPSLKSNGEDDDRALEKILDRKRNRQRGNPEKQKSQSEPGDDSKDDPTDQSPQNQSSKSKPSSDLKSNDPPKTDGSQPSADKPKKDPSSETSPMPRDDQSNSPKEKNADGSNNPKNDKNNAQSPSDSPKPADKDKAANSDTPSPDKSASPDKSSTKPDGNSDKKDREKTPTAGNDPAADKKDGEGPSKSPMKQSDGGASKDKPDSTGKANDPSKKEPPGQQSNDSKNSSGQSDKKQSDGKKPANDSDSKNDDSQGDDTKSKKNTGSPNASDSQKDSNNAQKPEQSDMDGSGEKKPSKQSAAGKHDAEKNDQNDQASKDKNDSGKKENSDDQKNSDQKNSDQKSSDQKSSDQKSSDKDASGKKADSSNDRNSKKSSDKNGGDPDKGNAKGSQSSPGKPSSQQSSQPSAGPASGSPGQGAASNNASQTFDKDGKPTGGQTSEGGDEASEEADPQFTKEAANLVLKKIKNELDRGDVDQELLDELGWTPEQMKKFVERMQQQLNAPEDDHTPAAQAKRRQFEEMLRNLNLTSKTQRRDDTNQDKQSGDAVGRSRRPAPAEYKDWFESYTKSQSKKQAAEPGKK